MAKFLDEVLTRAPAAYEQATDPALDNPTWMRTGVWWLDTTATPPTLKKRNAANDGWDTLGKIRTDAQFNEDVDDRVGALIIDSSSVGAAYDDGAGSLSLAVKDEWVEDKIGAKVVAGTGISVTYNDATGETEIENTDPGSGVGASALDDLTDVVISSPTTGEVLKFNGTNWVNDTDDTGGGGLSGSGVENYALLPSQASATMSTVASTANEVKAWRFCLPFGLTVASVHFTVGTLFSGGLCSIAVYDEAGTTKLIDTGAISTTTSGVKNVTLGAPVVLAAGWYWLAWTMDNATSRFSGPNNDVSFLGVLNGGTQQWGAAGNSSASGVMPSSLGGVATTSSVTPTPLVKLQG